MKNNFLKEIIVSLIIIFLLVFLVNPFDFWMPNSILIMIVLALLVSFALFVGFIWRENTQDEREELHIGLAGRMGFLIGSASLMLGIIVQCFQHNLDIWLVVTLAVMVLAKIAGLIYGQIKR